MTVPGLAPSFLPDAPPPPRPPSGVIDPPLDQAGADARIVVFPMSYLQSWGAGYSIPGGWDDATQINAALLKAGPGGHVHLVPGTYNTLSTIVVAGATPTQPGQRLSGERGTIIKPAFGGATSNTGAAISCHGSELGASRLQGYGAIIERLTIDGANVPGTAISTGLDFGDQYHGVIQDVTIQNFVSTGTTSSTGSNPLGAVGLNLNNQVTLTEKLHVRRVVINNCGTPNPTTSPNQGGGAAIQLVQTTGANASWQYSDIDVTVNTQPHQNGLVMARNGNLTNVVLFQMRGNFNCDANPASCASIVVGVANPGGGAPQAAHGFNCEINLDVESDGGSGGTTQPITIAFGTNVDNTLGTMHGRMVWSYAGGWQAATGMVAGGTSASSWQFSGRLKGDTSLFAALTPYVTPALGTQYTNNGPDATVYVTGGTLTAVLVNGISTGLLSGPFPVTMNSTIQFNGSVAPATVWVSALAN